MENKEFTVLTESFERYANTSFELVKMESANKVSLLGSALAGIVLLGFFAGTMILFLSFAFGMYLSSRLGNSYAGFFIVAAFYMMAGIVMYIFRNKYVIKPIRDFIVRKIYQAE